MMVREENKCVCVFSHRKVKKKSMEGVRDH